MECHYCGITKSLDHFSKQQRKDPDRAVSPTDCALGRSHSLIVSFCGQSCWDCMAERQNQPAGAGGSDDDSPISEDDDSYDDDSDDGVGTVSGTYATLSIDSSTARGTSSNGGVLLGSTGPGGHTGSTLSSTQGGGVALAGSRPIGTTTFGRAPSTVTQSSANPITTNSRGEKKGVFQDSSNDNKFAKVKAVRHCAHANVLKIIHANWRCRDRSRRKSSTPRRRTTDRC